MTNSAPNGSLLRVKPVSPRQFATFRIVLGLYLTIYLAHLIPYGAELLSREGMLPDASLNFTHRILPNPLEWADTPGVVTAFLIGLTILSISFTVGLFRRVTAVLLWFGLACLFNRNNLLSNPSIPYVGMILLMCAVIPAGEPWGLSRSKPGKEWFFPAWVFRAAWILMAVGYTFCGLDKLIYSPNWSDGTALKHVLNLPLAWPGFLREILLGLPEWMLKAATWSALALEVLFLPLCLHRRSRPWAWLAMVGMHIGITSLIAFADFSLGMLMLHFFTFDPEWFPARKNAEARSLVLYDGLCGLCDRTVQFFLEEDREGALVFSPLQGETAAEVFARHPDAEHDLSTMVCVANSGSDAEELSYRSSGILRLLSDVGGFWRVVSWLSWIPVPVRDRVYDLIARNRYKWFGKFDECKLPDPGTRARFLP